MRTSNIAFVIVAAGQASCDPCVSSCTLEGHAWEECGEQLQQQSGFAPICWENPTARGKEWGIPAGSSDLAWHECADGEELAANCKAVLAGQRSIQSREQKDAEEQTCEDNARIAEQAAHGDCNAWIESKVPDFP